jgi:hypothetical protein
MINAFWIHFWIHCVRDVSPFFRDLSRFLKEIDGRSDARIARSEARMQSTAEISTYPEMLIYSTPTISSTSVPEFSMALGFLLF